MIVHEKDVIYGRVGGAALLADLAYPSDRESLPAIMYVHGGRWFLGGRAGNALWEDLNVVKWAERGFFAVSIDYRLLGSSPVPAPYEDVQCAIRWLHANAGEYGIDPNRVYLIGDSAGGHLVSLAATLGEGPYARTGGWADAGNEIRAVISAAGAYDLNALDWGDAWEPFVTVADSVDRQINAFRLAPSMKLSPAQWAELDELGPGVGNRREFRTGEEVRRLASPLYQIGSTTKPMLVIHSDDDSSVPIQQALDMVQALKNAGIYHRFVHYADKGHMAVTADVIDETLAFIAEVESR